MNIDRNEHFSLPFLATANRINFLDYTELCEKMAENGLSLYALNTFDNKGPQYNLTPSRAASIMVWDPEIVFGK